MTAVDIAELARSRDRRALAAFAEYAELLAVAIHNYVVLYAPERVILAGSFAEAADLFLPAARSRLKVLLARRRKGIDLLPKLLVSPLKNRSGLIGGAWIALR
jgi:predicted NBD/HSP70 family sugar kinase